MKMLNRLFELDKHATTVRVEVMAGVTTFLTMAYITVVNPSILSAAGMDFGAVFVATCIAAAIGSVIMGLYANYPIAQAPGMGQNAFFTFSVVLGMGHSWQTALGAVFVSGMIFVVLSVLPVREWLINAIPRSLKLGMAAGIGLFLGFIAFKNAGIVVQNDATFVTLGNIVSFEPLVCLAAFVIIAALAARRVRGAVIIGILAATVVGWLFGKNEFHGLLAMPPSPAPVLLQLDIAAALQWSMLTVILSMLIVDVFDTAGTLIGVATRAGLVDADGKLPRIGKALLSDSTATVVGAIAGTSSTTSYIESAAGVEAGGRTGLTAVVCGLLFIGCLFFAPLAQSVPAYATAAALLFVACLMTRSLADIDWPDVTESAPAVVAAITMPLAFSIAEGIGLGFISYVLIKLVSGRARDCSPAAFVIAAIFALKYLFL
ncbi:MAG: NCS2 family permease [Gammaproteobacteria bacterium]|nr:NCS2 family permease [Gammaproteobacteria bacterium]MDH5323468.1 NCS2 family permease [Gammaproteobacteria bacterium]